MDLDQQIPGYAEALAWENEAREIAFLDLARDLCGVEVVALTLRRMRTLISAGSPFFGGGVPTDGDVAVFLWALSPRYDARDAVARALFVEEFRRVRTSGILLEEIRAIGTFLDEMFNDAPASGPSSRAAGCETETSFEAALVDTVAAEYHWTEAAILDCPLPRLYQYLRRIAKRANPKARSFSRRSKRAKGNWLRSGRAAAANV